jgi:lysyl-tRNA synthetase class 2
MSLNLSEQEIVRREALKKLRDMGIDPYPAEQIERTHYSTEIKKKFEQGEELKDVRLNGRLMAKRIMGKASFAELQDALGRIQLYFNRDDISPGEDKSMYNDVFKKLLDIGDFISVEGFAFRTQMGEISIHVASFKVLSKSIRPLPVVKTDASGNTHDAFADPEQRYRQRYVDFESSTNRLAKPL